MVYDKEKPTNHPVRVAVVGAGYFGSAHCAKFALIPNASLVAIVDSDPKKANETADKFGAHALSSHLDLRGLVDGAIIASPASSHFEIAKDLLNLGVHVLVEKPLSCASAQAEELCRIAKEHSLQIQVGHLERFNPAFVEAQKRILHPVYIRLERCGPFSGRGGDVSVVFDLMTHDLDILMQFARSPVDSISAVGQAVVTKNIDAASVRVSFRDGLVAELFASRTSSRKTRGFVVLDSMGVLEVDLMAGRLRRVSKKEPSSPEELELPPSDSLLDQDLAFVESIRNNFGPLVSGEDGRRAVALAESISKTIAEGCL
jgi:predicted dehydrogenase